MTETTTLKANIQIHVESEKQQKELEKALANMVKKLGPEGIINMNNLYEKDFFIQKAVNKKLKIK